jgi:predicted XRE-type DNA-binding protein
LLRYRHKSGRGTHAESRHFMSVKTTRSNRNVFRDLGFDVEEAEHLRIRADLMIELQKRIIDGGHKQADPAKILKVTQPRVIDLLNGRIDLFSTDAFMDMLACFGAKVHLVLKPSRNSRRVA